MFCHFLFVSCQIVRDKTKTSLIHWFSTVPDDFFPEILIEGAEISYYMVEVWQKKCDDLILNIWVTTFNAGNSVQLSIKMYFSDWVSKKNNKKMVCSFFFFFFYREWKKYKDKKQPLNTFS